MFSSISSLLKNTWTSLADSKVLIDTSFGPKNNLSVGVPEQTRAAVIAKQLDTVGLKGEEDKLAKDLRYKMLLKLVF